VKYPLVRCRKCERHIAAGPVAGHLSKGRLWRHDPPPGRRDPSQFLVSCPGSLAIVPLPVGQMELPVERPAIEEQPEPAADDPVLF
jgi:hypothetical protein